MYRSNILPKAFSNGSAEFRRVRSQDRLINGKIFLMKELDRYSRISIQMTCNVDCSSKGARLKANSNQEFALRKRLSRISLRI